MKAPTIKQLNSEINAFNAKYKVGDPVNLRLDNGDIKPTKVRTEAYISCGSAVAFFDGISGYYLIDRVVG